MFVTPQATSSASIRSLVEPVLQGSMEGSFVGRVDGKSALIFGGGQTPGETIGNGRATALLLAREGARLLIADRSLESAEETAKLIRDEGGEAEAIAADIEHESQVEAAIRACLDAYGAIDILHNN